MSETTTDEEREALRDTSEKIAELLMDRHDLTDANNALVCTAKTHHAKSIIERMNAAPIPSPAADVERLREALDSIRQYGADTLSGRADGGADDRQWQREAVREMTRRAREALSSVPSPAPAGLSVEETRKDNAPPASSPANDMIVEPRSPNLRG